MTLLYITAALSIGFAVALLVMGEVGLSGTGRESQYAFYAADFGAECALYWDLKHPNTAESVFAVPPPTLPYSVSISCGGFDWQAIYTDPNKYLFFSSLDNGTCVNVTVEKLQGGGARITALGHNICPPQTGRQIERGLQVSY